MVRGFDRFRDHFKGEEHHYALIGGVAAEAWLTERGLRFRATKDVDMVLVVEVLDDDFMNRVWDFVRAGKYERKERDEGTRQRYRFSRPADPTYPAMLEIFSRTPDGLVLGADQEVVPIAAQDDASSLSAILMDDDYYRIVLEDHDLVAGVPCVTPAGLILLKARAWSDLSARRAAGQAVDARDVLKHRNDVFRLAVLLRPTERKIISARVQGHLGDLLASLPADSPLWKDIAQAAGLGAAWPGAPALLALLREYFQVERA